MTGDGPWNLVRCLGGPLDGTDMAVDRFKHGDEMPREIAGPGGSKYIYSEGLYFHEEQ